MAAPVAHRAAPAPSPAGVLPRKEKPPLARLPLAFAALALAASAVVLGSHYWSLYRDTVMARTLLREAEEILQDTALDAHPSDLDGADHRLAEAERRLARAWRRLQADPLAALARRLPLTSEQVRAVDGLLAVAADGAAAGRLGISAAREYHAVRGQGPLSEKARAVLDRTRDPMAAAAARLDVMAARRQDLQGLALLPPLEAALGEVDDGYQQAREAVGSYQDASAFLPQFLGFDGPRTYLVLAQNNAELLPTGGLISVVGIMRLNQGRIEEQAFEDAIAFGERWLSRTGQYMEPPAPLKNYLLKGWSWNLALSNWSPDFPSAAAQALDFYYRGGGRPVDGVLALDVITLEELLDVTGPVEVPEYGVTVDSANALEVTETLTRSPLEPGGDRKAFVAALAERLIPRLVDTPPDRWSLLLRTLERLRDERHLLFYSSDPEFEALARRMGLDGALRASEGDYTMVVDASVNSTKLNIALEQSASLEVQLDALGDARSRLDLTYQNNLPLWEAGRDPDVVYRLMLDGLYGGYVRLLTPAGSHLTEIRLDGRVAGAEEIGWESGKAVFGRFFSLARGEGRTVSFLYALPAVVRRDGSAATYRLYLQTQPGTRAIPWKVKIVPPAQARALSLEVDGKATGVDAGAGVEVATDLRHDREIVLRYRLESPEETP